MMRINIFFFSLVFSSTILLSPASHAQTKYYVATAANNGSDANNGKSLAAPFASIAKALLNATTPGDTIFVRSGTYTLSLTVKVNVAGTSAKHIVLTAYKPDLVNANSRPLFDFSSMLLASANRGFALSGANYWDIWGIVIKGAGDNGMNVSGSSHTTIEFCSFTRSRDSGLQLGGSSHHILIINCDSYENADLGTGSTTAGGNADGYAAKLDIGDSIVFRSCRSWMNSDDGWDGYMRPAGGVSWSMEDCWAFRNGYYWLDGSSTSSMNGNGFKTGGSDNKDLDHNCTLVKCLAFLNKANGFDQNSNAGSISLYNCSSYKNFGRDFYMTSAPVTYVAGAQLVVKNCLSLGAYGVSFPTAGTTARGLTTATNSFKTTTTTTEILSFDTTGVTGIRSLDGSLPVLNFMRLNTAAAMPFTYIDKGTALPTVLYQGAVGVPYTGTAPDIGAFESPYNILPVELVSFSAMPKNNTVLLNWKTALSINNRGWEVERTTDLSSGLWAVAGFVKGTAESNYSLADNGLLPGLYYYRLKQYDLDGKFHYSNTVQVKTDAENGQHVPVMYPNPLKTNGTISYIIAAADKVSLAIYNTEGKKVVNILEEMQPAGYYSQPVVLATLAPGMYFVKLMIGGTIFTNSFVKQ